MENKTAFTFKRYIDYEDGKIALLTLADDEYPIPIDVDIDNVGEFKIKSGEKCFIDVCGIGSDVEVFETEDTYKKAENTMAPVSLIPMGTFPANPDETNFE